MAQEAGLVGRALAEVGPYSIVACSAIEAGLLGAVVDVNLAVMPLVAVDTDAAVAALGVGAGRPVVADARPHGALVDVLCTIAAFVFGWALACVRIDAVDAAASILTKVARAVVNVDVASWSGETYIKTWRIKKPNRQRNELSL